MKIVLLLLTLLLYPLISTAEEQVWTLVDSEGNTITEICYEPTEGDEYISAENELYKVVRVENGSAYVALSGDAELPSVEWMDSNAAYPVMAMSKQIGLYCTHSDESYEPSDGYYSTRERGTIYQVAQAFADALIEKGVNAELADTLHHPHDAGAYRRSRQTAIQLLKHGALDCLIDIHRDGIPDPSSYAVTIGGKEVSKIRLLVGRGNQNAELNKEFALMIKAVGDRVYPGLIKDIYMGKGAFNQDLLPRSILLECGTYTLEKERVLQSMPMMADVLNRALYGGLIGSVGQTRSDVQDKPEATAGITMGEPDTIPNEPESGISSGIGFLGLILGIGVIGIAVLSAGSWKRGGKKSARNLSEMTGGLIGKRPEPGEDHEHS